MYSGYLIMDVLILARISACLFVIACVFDHSVSAQFDFPKQKMKGFERRNMAPGSNGENCIGNDTAVFPGLDCYVDEKYSCLEKICGRLDLLQPKASMWECIEYNASGPFSMLGCYLNIMRGYWMVSKCPSDSPNELKGKCEKASSRFPKPVKDDNIPVVGEHGLTYRNKYCALCHGVQNFTAWDVWVRTDIRSARGYDLDSQMKNNFFLAIGVLPRWNQPRRVCLGRSYVHNSSKSTDKSIHKICTEGPFHSLNDRYNFCRGEPYSGSLCHDRISCPISLVFKLKEYTVPIKNCPPGTVYDSTLNICRKKSMILPSRKLTNEYLFLLWIKETTYVKRYFKLALISGFSLKQHQISSIVFHKQGTMNKKLIVATFHFTLTAFQNLIMDNEQNAILNVTDDETAFLKLLNYSGNFTLRWENKSFAVVKMVSKQLSCYGEVKFQSDEYEMNESNTSFVLIKTGKIFSLQDYNFVRKKGGNITLCRKLVLPDCREGAFVPLRPNEYVVFPNLSVYHNAIQKMFNFGDYLISESKDNLNILYTSLNSNLHRNSTVAVCLPFNTTDDKTVKKHSFELGILTLIGFIVSIICLIFLMVTYGLFRELRTVPGMNLMSLSLSMLLSDLIWLIGTSHFTETTACKVFAILEHYLFLGSFLAMSIISYHSFLVFSRPFEGRHFNTSWRRFVKYSAVVWLTPAVFVAICVTLDEIEVFPVDYGTNCWLGTVNGILYLFLLPLAISLLYNIYTFIKTARLLFRHDERRDILQRKEGKQNLVICIKLASLVGLPWLFAFLGVLFPDEIAFEYLFVVFVSLQGLCVGLAFLFSKKTLNLYKKRWNICSRRNAPLCATASIFGF